MCHECVNVTRSGRDNPKFCRVCFVHQWLNPLSKFLDPPTSPYPALSAEAEPIFKGHCKDESFMPDISSYIWERIKVNFACYIYRYI